MKKKILITGANTGIGLATAEFFLEKNWLVIGTVRNLENIPNKLVNHKYFHIAKLDLNDAHSIANLAATLLQKFGNLDVLVNNAGHFQMGPLETTSMEQIRRQFEVNLFGPTQLTKALLPIFRKQCSGNIINVASVSAAQGYPFCSVYSASKAAIVMLSESLNIELAPLGISVKTILPGTYATKLFTKMDQAASLPQEYEPGFQKFFQGQNSIKGGNPAEVAEVIYQAVTDGNAEKVRYYVGYDSVSTPFFKRLLGEDRYFAFVKKVSLRGPGFLLKKMIERSGYKTLEFKLSPPLAALFSTKSSNAGP